MGKIELKKELKHLYDPSSTEVSVVDVPAFNFLMVDGAGDPNNSQEFQDAMDAVFSVSYTLKFMVKKGKTAVDYAVMPPEGLWWTGDMAEFNMEDKDSWLWTVMIMQPPVLTRELVAEAVAQVEKKKNPPALSKLRFESYREGLSAQIMHLGPFSAEGPTIKRLHDFIRENGYELAGKHHEIYLSDVRRITPEKWKTVIRQPVKQRVR